MSLNKSLYLVHSHLGEGLFDVCNQVGLGLNAYGEAHKVVFDAEQLSLFLGHGEVGHQGWVLSERLNAAKRLSQSEQIE